MYVQDKAISVSGTPEELRQSEEASWRWWHVFSSLKEAPEGSFPQVEKVAPNGVDFVGH